LHPAAWKSADKAVQTLLKCTHHRYSNAKSTAYWPRASIYCHGHMEWEPTKWLENSPLFWR